MKRHWPKNQVRKNTDNTPETVGLPIPKNDTTSTATEAIGRTGSSAGSKGNGSGSGDGKARRPSPPKKKTQQKRDCSSKIKGVRKVGENRYVIPAAVVDTYVNDLKKLKNWLWSDGQ